MFSFFKKNNKPSPEESSEDFIGYFPRYGEEPSQAGDVAEPEVAQELPDNNDDDGVQDDVVAEDSGLNDNSSVELDEEPSDDSIISDDDINIPSAEQIDHNADIAQQVSDADVDSYLSAMDSPGDVLEGVSAPETDESPEEVLDEPLEEAENGAESDSEGLGDVDGAVDAEDSFDSSESATEETVESDEDERVSPEEEKEFNDFIQEGAIEESDQEDDSHDGSSEEEEESLLDSYLNEKAEAEQLEEVLEEDEPEEASGEESEIEEGEDATFDEEASDEDFDEEGVAEKGTNLEVEPDDELSDDSIEESGDDGVDDYDSVQEPEDEYDVISEIDSLDSELTSPELPVDSAHGTDDKDDDSPEEGNTLETEVSNDDESGEDAFAEDDKEELDNQEMSSLEDTEDNDDPEESETPTEDDSIEAAPRETEVAVIAYDDYPTGDDFIAAMDDALANRNVFVIDMTNEKNAYQILPRSIKPQFVNLPEGEKQSAIDISSIIDAAAELDDASIAIVGTDALGTQLEKKFEGLDLALDIALERAAFYVSEALDRGVSVYSVSQHSHHITDDVLKKIDSTPISEEEAESDDDTQLEG